MNERATHISSGKPRHTFSTKALLVAAALALLGFASAQAARAASISDSEELAKFGSEGFAAGQLNLPTGIATDPVTGHVFVIGGFADAGRISEFTPWGQFVKAFGWDVAPGSVNEQQEVRVRASSGQFELEFEGEPTADLAFDAAGSEAEGPGSVEAALNALPSISSGGGSVSVEAVPGNPNGETPYIYVIAFKGSLAATDVAQLTISNGTTPLAGGDPAPELEVRTRADGHAATTGLEACTAESGCKRGLSGSGPGELGDARNLAVDADGNIYVKEVNNHRVQKFDPAGRFLLAFGGEVDKTTSANVCTAASGDECGPGVTGNGPGEFGAALAEGITIEPGETLFVGDEARVQRFNLEGEYEAQFPLTGGNGGELAFDSVSGDLYAIYVNQSGVHKLDPSTGAEIGQPLPGQSSLAVDSAGDVFAGGAPGSPAPEGVLEYGPDGKPLTPPGCCEPEKYLSGGSGLQPFRLSALGTNPAGDLYAGYFDSSIDSFIRSFGPGPTMYEAPPKVPPTIEAQYATSVERTGAVLGADINPHFWTDTRYYVQYGTGKCTEGGCEVTKPLPPGAPLAAKPVDKGVKTAGVFLEGLKPGTTYHYRFIAQSTGGGPVHGIDPDGEGPQEASEEAGEEATFTTYPAAAPPKTNCSNQQFRVGFSALLTDCRAFEMVSPVDKNNGDITVTNGEEIDQSATDGGRFTYTSYRAFADPEAAVNANQYLATRVDGVGWQSEAMAPPHGPASHQGELNEISRSLENEYKAFSPDLCQGWLTLEAEAPLQPAPMEGHFELFHREGCASPEYRALIEVEPQIEGIEPFLPELQGTSADGQAAVMQVKGALTPDASKNAYQAYYASQGGLRLICVLPSGAPSAGNCSAGTSGADDGGLSRNSRASLHHAISSDGSHVYWTASIAQAEGAGKVYLRLNPGREQSEVSGGECTESEMACTVKVSESVTSKASRFLAATPDGSRALFEVTEGTNAGNLYELEAETGESTLIAKKVGRKPFHSLQTGLVGASEDLSYVYFVSEEALAAGAEEGEPNLYLYQEGTTTLVAGLSDVDVNATVPDDVSPQPFAHAARVSPDGRHLAFISTVPPVGYDNTDQVSAEADSEVYLYEAGSPGPVCVSCNPSGARPRGRMEKASAAGVGALPTAAFLSLPQTQLYSGRPLADDGHRLFFNSYDALLPRDTNGQEDVYEWEQASSRSACEEKGAELYVQSSGGCLSLISSGESPQDSEFLDASEGGRDVFFTTNQGLLPQDPGLIDVYDAREGGGLPTPPAPPGPCEGEACQFAPPPPNDPTPASASFRGQGNLEPRPSARCAKGKARRGGRCVAKKQRRPKRHHHRANQKRRQSR